MKGCAMGRLMGELLNDAFPDFYLNPGTFALIGAAAFLGGVVRMTMYEKVKDLVIYLF